MPFSLLKPIHQINGVKPAVTNEDSLNVIKKPGH